MTDPYITHIGQTRCMERVGWLESALETLATFDSEAASELARYRRHFAGELAREARTLAEVLPEAVDAAGGA